MAVVWQADDQRLGRPVAVKVLDPAGLGDASALAQFDREARTVAQLTHPNVVTVHDVGVDDGVPYLVMELVAGRSLADLLSTGPLSVDEAVRITHQVCAALTAAHAAGVVHRDVKPANILITTAGTVKVCDFGIAHPPHGARASRTAVATATGTSEYMAPEQLAGHRVDHRADLYALGCVVYAMLTGHPPFQGETPYQVGWQHLNDEPASVGTKRSGVPADLAGLVDQLLAKDPAQRPISAAQVSARLPNMPAQRAPTGPGTTVADARGLPIRGSAAVMHRTQTMPVLDYADEPPARPGHGIRLSPAWFAGLAVVAIAAIVIAIVALTNQQPRAEANGPGGTPSSATSPASSPPSTPATSVPSFASADEAINAIEDTMQTQVDANLLDRDVAKDVSHQLNDIGHHHGGDGDSASKVADIADTLRSARADNKIQSTAYATLTQMLNQLAGLLSQGDNHNN
jgi:serine/threonine-protein kinase